MSDLEAITAERDHWKRIAEEAEPYLSTRRRYLDVCAELKELRRVLETGEARENELTEERMALFAELRRITDPQEGRDL
jgi:hypothetical protein